MANIPPSIKGIRHAHSRITLCSKLLDNIKATNEASVDPMAVLEITKPQCKPLLFLLNSLTIVIAPGISAPKEMPWRILQIANRITAVFPAVLYVGSNPMPSVANAIINIIAKKDFLRPKLSAIRPVTIPPNGLNM